MLCRSHLGGHSPVYTNCSRDYIAPEPSLYGAVDEGGGCLYPSPLNLLQKYKNVRECIISVCQLMSDAGNNFQPMSGAQSTCYQYHQHIALLLAPPVKFFVCIGL